MHIDLVVNIASLIDLNVLPSSYIKCSNREFMTMKNYDTWSNYPSSESNLTIGRSPVINYIGFIYGIFTI